MSIFVCAWCVLVNETDMKINNFIIINFQFYQNFCSNLKFQNVSKIPAYNMDLKSEYKIVHRQINSYSFLYRFISGSVIEYPKNGIYST